MLDPSYPLKKRKEGITLATAILDKYVGYYELRPGVIFHITRDGNGLSAQLTGQPAVPIYPKSETQFFYTVVDAQITFVKDADGKATQLILHQGGQDLPARKIE